MLVGTLVIKVHIPGSTSLKDKRKVVKSVLQRARNRFNVSIVELNNEDLWQSASIGIAQAGDNLEHIQRQLQLLLNFLDAEPRWEIVHTKFDLS